ncbi:MAG: hypothetical protein Q9162_005198 [Coniocarpon cinnabarinum]
MKFLLEIMQKNARESTTFQDDSPTAERREELDLLTDNQSQELDLPTDNPSEEPDSPTYDRPEELAEILEVLDQEALSKFAVETRQKQMLASLPSNPSCSISAKICLDVEPMFGTFNILFPIVFNDGTKWLLRLPRTGTADDYDISHAAEVESEPEILKMLRQETGIPVPEVYASETGHDKVGYPFVLMEYLEGDVLQNVWFSIEVTPSTLQERRLRILDELAAAMIQLQKWTFDEGGLVLVDTPGKLESPAAQSYEDLVPVWEPVEPGTKKQSPANPSFELGPFQNVEEYFTGHVSHRLQTPNLLIRQKGNLLLVKRMLAWLNLQHGAAQFELAHPDFGTRNCMVCEDGHVTGIIDWDGLQAVPKILGCLSYPEFLTRDWDPNQYDYDPNETESDGLPSIADDSPETLKFYRDIYLSNIEKHLAKWHGVEGNDANVTELVSAGATTTRRSLIFGALYSAVRDPCSTSGVARKIFNEISKIDQELRQQASAADTNDMGSFQAPPNGTMEEHDEVVNDTDDEDDFESDQLYFYNIITDIAAGELDPEVEARIKGAFEQFMARVDEGVY